MDNVRKIRFLIPSFFLYLSLLLGLSLSEDSHNTFKALGEDYNVLKILAVALAASIPVGFLISTVSLFLLRMWYWILRKPNTFEFILSNETVDDLYSRLKLQFKHDGSETTMEEAAVGMKRKQAIEYKRHIELRFSHGDLKNEYPGLHDWFVRRFSWCLVSVHSIVAIALSFIGIRADQIQYSNSWLVYALFGVLPLLYSALVTRSEITSVEKMLAEEVPIPDPEVPKNIILHHSLPPKQS